MKRKASEPDLGPSRPTMADIARIAGVSVATVSRTLAGSGPVSAKNQKLVTAAVGQTGYVVNEVARGLRLQRAGHVLVLVPNIANPFFSGVLLGIETALQEAGLGMLVGNTGGDPDREASLSRSLLTGGTDGLILLTGRMPTPILDAPRAAGRIVAVSEPIAGVPTVSIANADAAATATRHLIGLGHRRIAHIGGPADNALTQGRMEGFHTAMASARLSVPRNWVCLADFSIAFGEQAMRQLLSLRTRPTAVVCGNDEIAIGAIKAAREQGLSVPRDLSVTGFDDIDVAYAFNPALTTIRQPRHDFGQEAARILLSLLDGNMEVKDRLLPVELIVRGSTDRPREATRDGER